MSNGKLEKDIIATLAVMENQLIQSLDHQKSIRDDISILTKEISGIQIKISSLEQSSNTCDKQVIESINDLKKEIVDIKFQTDENKSRIEKHDTFINKLKEDQSNREQIRHKVTAGVLQYLAIAIIGIFGVGLLFYVNQDHQVAPPSQNK